jgi:hypothetical protein
LAGFLFLKKQYHSLVYDTVFGWVEIELKVGRLD